MGAHLTQLSQDRDLRGKEREEKYRSTAVAERRLPFALLAKEFGRFASSPSYMLNCGLGVLLLPVLGAVFLIKGGSFISILGEMFGPNRAPTASR